MRNDFQKEDCQGENPFAKGFSPWTLFPKTPISVAAQGGEMTHWGARTRQIGTFPVNRENIRVFAGGFGNRLFTQKAGSRNFPLPSSPRADCGAKETIHCAKKFPPNPPQQTLNIVGFLTSWTRKWKTRQNNRNFWRGVWGATFFKKVLPRLFLTLPSIRKQPVAHPDGQAVSFEQTFHQAFYFRQFIVEKVLEREDLTLAELRVLL